MLIDEEVLGQGEWVEITKADIFKEWTFWNILTQEFLTQSNASTNYLTQLNASSTYLSQLDANSTYATKTELGTKQSVIPDFELVSSQTMLGVSVKVYTDGLTVYVSISGNLDGSSSVPSNGSASDIGTLSNISYAPYTAMQSPIRLSDNTSKMILGNDGKVRLVNGESSKTYLINCSFYYPLKSRIL